MLDGYTTASPQPEPYRTRPIPARHVEPEPERHGRATERARASARPGTRHMTGEMATRPNAAPTLPTPRANK